MHGPQWARRESATLSRHTAYLRRRSSRNAIAARCVEGSKMPSKPKSPKKPSPDKLVKTTGKNDIELKEEDLDKVTGGLIALLDKNKG
jgi:hypothetical protein